MSGSELAHIGFEIAVVGAVLPYYFYVLAACVCVCAVLTWRDYENRVSAFGLSFSLWFVVVWVVIASTFLVGRRSDPFVTVFAAAVCLTLALFTVAASVSAWFFFRREPVEANSPVAVRVGVVLLLAHILHLLLATFFTALAAD